MIILQEPSRVAYVGLINEACCEIVISGRVLSIERHISLSAKHAIVYAEYVIVRRWPFGEKAISQNKKYWDMYSGQRLYHYRSGLKGFIKRKFGFKR